MKNRFIALLSLSVLSLAGCEKTDSDASDKLIERKDFVLTRSEMDFIQDNNGFALDLFKRVAAKEDGKSVLISPLSVTMDLGMVNNGAAGSTRDEINRVLGYKDGSVDGLNSFCKSMLKQSSKVDPSTTVEICNAAVINKSLVPLKDGFSKTIKSAYSAEVVYKEFGQDDVKGFVNNWCNKKTQGVIPSILEEQPGSDDYAFFLNAVYFKGRWSEKFFEYDTKQEDFTLDDGSRKTVPMMWQKNKFSYCYTTGLCSTICLPYGNEAYRMIILLPQDGMTLEGLKESLDQDKWSSIIKGMSKVEVDVKIPKFETATDLLHIEDALQEMGISKAFSKKDADFSGMTKETVYIGDILHKARIKVDELGTEAAAVTSTGLSYASGWDSIEFHADHPFIYAITEVSSGAIFFIGQYTGR